MRILGFYMVISSDSGDNVTEANLSYRVSVGNDPGTFGWIKPRISGWKRKRWRFLRSCREFQSFGCLMFCSSDSKVEGFLREANKKGTTWYSNIQ